MRRRDFIKLVGSAATAWPLSANAQADVTLTIKKTIDPGFSPIEINKDEYGEEQLFFNPSSRENPIADS